MAKKQKENKSNKYLTILGIIMCIILTPILILNITLISKSFTNPNEVPSINGYIPMIILTDSMYPEIESGDLIIINKNDIKNIKPNDIITFFDPKELTKYTTTHRVVEVLEESGKKMYKTKGDSNNTLDKELVPKDKIIGVYKTRIKGLGKFSIFMSSPTGIIIIIGIIIICLFMWDIFIKTEEKE